MTPGRRIRPAAVLLAAALLSLAVPSCVGSRRATPPSATEASQDEDAARSEESPRASPSPSPTSASSADELRVFCGEGTTEASGRHVEAAEDGVHLRIQWAKGFDGVLFLTLMEREEGMTDTWTIGRRGSIVLQIPPGIVYMKCSEGRASNDPVETFTQLRVVDPERYWVSPEPECRRAISVGRDPVAGRGVATMEEAVREGLAGVLPTDVVQRAGYPAATEGAGRTIVIRAGRTLASANVTFVEDLFFFFGGAVCPGTGISLPGESTG